MQRIRHTRSKAMSSRRPKVGFHGKLGHRMEGLEPRMMLSGDGAMTPAFEAGGFNPAVTSIVSAPFTPKQMETAYGESGLHFGTVLASGAGQTIAIIDAYNDPTIVSDLHAFDTYYHLAAPPSFKVYDEYGNQINPANQGTVTTGYGTFYGAIDNTYVAGAPAWFGVNPMGVVPNGSAGGWDIEESLDVEWAHAMAPKASIELIETNSNAYSGNPYGLSDMVWGGGFTAGNSPGVSAVTMSWGGGEYSSETYAGTGGNGDGEFGQFQAPYKTYLASTGDYYVSGPQQVQYPSASNRVVGVGGTSLVALAPSGTYLSESGWGNNYGASTGGYSNYETNTFQYGGGGPYDKSVPDLSADADPYTGVDIVDSYYWGNTTPFGNIGGTSLASPLMAGIVAEVNQGRVLAGKPTLQNLEQDLYNGGIVNWSTDFHDPFNGSNGYFSAGSGYDYVTGIGSPNGSTFINALVSASSSAVVSTGAATAGSAWNIPTTSGSGGGAVHPIVVGVPSAPTAETISAGPTASAQVTSNVQVVVTVPMGAATSAGAATQQVAVAPAAADASFAALSADSTAEDVMLGGSLGSALSGGRDSNTLFGGSTSESSPSSFALRDAPREAQSTVAAPVAELAPVDAVFAAEAAVAIETELSSGLVDGDHPVSVAAMDSASLVPLAVVLAGYWASGNSKDSEAAKKRARREFLRLQQR